MDFVVPAWPWGVALSGEVQLLAVMAALESVDLGAPGAHCRLSGSRRVQCQSAVSSVCTSLSLTSPGCTAGVARETGCTRVSSSGWAQLGALWSLLLTQFQGRSVSCHGLICSVCECWSASRVPGRRAAVFEGVLIPTGLSSEGDTEFRRGVRGGLCGGGSSQHRASSDGWFRCVDDLRRQVNTCHLSPNFRHIMGKEKNASLFHRGLVWMLWTLVWPRSQRPALPAVYSAWQKPSPRQPAPVLGSGGPSETGPVREPRKECRRPLVMLPWQGAVEGRGSAHRSCSRP